MDTNELDRRLMLYGVGSAIAGSIIARFGPPAISESPRRRRERPWRLEELVWMIPGWTIAGIGSVVAVSGFIRAFAHCLARDVGRGPDHARGVWAEKIRNSRSDVV